MSNKEFPWGQVVKEHVIGDHHITEYISGPGWSDAGQTLFQVDLGNSGASWPTLDGALLHSICNKAGAPTAAEWCLKLMVRDDEDE